MLLLTRRLLAVAYADQQHVWDRSGVGNGSVELTGATMVILGMGNIGRQIAKRAVAFEMRVIGVDLKPGELRRRRGDLGHGPAGRGDRAGRRLRRHPADHAESYHLIDGRRLALLGPQDYLIVVSRGGIIDEPRSRR